MTTLDELSGTPPVSLDEYDVDVQENVPAMPVRSVQNQAAHAALLSTDPEEVIQNYKLATEEMLNQGTSKTASDLILRASAEADGQSQDALMDMLADEQYSDDQKRSFVKAYSDGQLSGANLTDTLSEHALIADSGDEGLSAAATRMTWADIMQDTNTYNKQKQKLIQDVSAKFEATSATETTGEFFEMMMPGAYNKQNYQLMSSLKEHFDESGTLWDFAWTGSTILEMQKLIEDIDPSDPRKLRLAELFIDSVNNENGIYLSDHNEFMNVMVTQQVLNGDYSQTEAYVDNTFSMLGLAGPLLLLKGAISGSKLARTLTKATQEAATTTTSPASVSQTMKNANPDKARQLHAAVEEDKTGEVASAVYDTNRTDAIAGDLAMQPASSTAIITPKLTQAAKNVTPAKQGENHLVDFVTNDELHSFTDAEKDSARARATARFNSPGQVRHHQEISTIESTPEGLKINAIYGDKDGGYPSAREAVESVANEFRDFGIVPEDMVLLRRSSEGYVPYRGGLDVEGDFVVKIDFDYRINSANIDEWTAPNIKLNFMNRVQKLASWNIQRHILNAQSYLDPLTTGSASLAIDRTNNVMTALNKLADPFIDHFKKLGDTEKNAVTELLHTANRDGIRITESAMNKARLTPETKKALGQFREFWDEMWKLEDYDATRTLQSRGFKVWDKDGTKIFGKKVNKQVHTGRVYDPETNTVKTLSPAEMDELYKSKGSFMQMRTPMKIDGEDITYMIDNNKMRALRPGIDNSLAYREGYFQTRYNGSHFVIKTVRDDKGKELYQQAIAVGGSKKEIEAMRQSIIKEGGVADDLKIREDTKGMHTDSDSYWEVSTAGGRTSQRFRGKPLQEAGTVDEAGLGTKYMDSPILAARSAAQSISRRVAMRDWLENTKQRTLATYAEFFPKVKGRNEWVSDIGLLQTAGQETSKKAADARAMVEYINSMENGYIDGTSAAWKGTLNAMADMVGSGSSLGEKALRKAAGFDPVNKARSGVFTSMIVMNPLRQLILQPMQALRLFAQNPVYMSSLNGVKEQMAVLYVMSGKRSDATVAAMSGLDAAKVKELREFVTKSGIWEGVDNNNLVRSNALSLTDRENMLSRGVGHATNVTRQVGFDFGERINVTSAMLAFRDAAKKTAAKGGKKYSDEDVYIKARAYTYSMNEADDMPYNQNALRVLMQFAQVPHKASTNWLNRNLSRKERLQSVVGDSILYGVPTAGIYNYVMGTEGAIEDPVLQKALKEGMFEIGVNEMLTAAVGEEVDLDIAGSFAPTDMTGILETIHLTATGGLTAYGDTPFQNYLGRIGKLFDVTSMYFGASTKYGENNVELWDVTESALKIASGYSNFAKYKMYLDTHKKWNADGTRISDHNINSVEAFAGLLGIQTNTEADMFTLNRNIRDKKQALKDDVKIHLDVISRYLAMEGSNPAQANFYTNSIRMVGNVMKDRLGWEDELNRQLKFRAMDGDHAIYNNIIKSVPFTTTHELKVMANQPGLTDSQRESIIRYADDIESFRKENK